MTSAKCSGSLEPISHLCSQPRVVPERGRCAPTAGLCPRSAPLPAWLRLLDAGMPSSLPASSGHVAQRGL